MDFVQGLDRLQMTITSLEERIAQQNPVRFVDAFVEKMDLKELGFVLSIVKREGRPPFETKVFMKIYVYAYLNGLRSSRKIARECERNVELQWLTGNLHPNYHSIADFRKVNPKALKGLFKLFVSYLKDMDLVKGEIIATDGTKIRGNNSKKNNHSKDKIERQLKYIDERAKEYLLELEKNDKEEEPLKIKDIKEKLERLSKNKIKYELLGEQLEQNDQTQISTTDPDSRLLLVKGFEQEVGYNIQASVEEKHKLVVATHAINETDRNALSAIAIEAKENLKVETLTNLGDKGYHTAKEIYTCQANGISTIIAPRKIANSKAKGTTPEYLIDKFKYNKEQNNYTCPAGNILSTIDKEFTKKKEGHEYKFKTYKTTACKSCPVKHLCTASKHRVIERSEYADAVDANNQSYQENLSTYKTRQQLNEHVFGTIKRTWGYTYTNMSGLEKVNGEAALIMTVYNIKRVLNILKWEDLMEKLEKWVPKYDKITKNIKNQLLLNYFRSIKGTFNYQMKMAV